MILPHQVLPKKEARVEPLPYFLVYLVGVVHELLQLFRQGDHAFGEGREQFLDQVEILVIFFAFDFDGLSFQSVERHLEVDLLELVDEPLCLFELIQFHFI